MLISSVAGAVIYVALLIPTLQSGWRRGATPWLAFYLLVSAFLAALPAAAGMGLFARLSPELSPACVFVVLALAGLGLLGAMTFKYLELRRAWLWPLLNAIFLGGLVYLDTTLPAPTLRDLTSLRAALALPQPPLTFLLAAGLWAANGLVLLGLGLRAIRQASLPLHANRNLLWLFVLPLVLAGEAALVLGGSVAGPLGQAARLAGAACAVYAVTSDRLVDVRSMFRSGLGNAVVVLFTAAVALLGIGLAQFLSGMLAGEARLAAALGVALVLALGYQLTRGPIERLVNRTVLRAGYDPAQVTRDYSRNIASILDVDQLSLAAAETLRQSVETRRAALLLLVFQADGIRVEAVPGIGAVPSVAGHLAINNPVLRAIKDSRRPILQYDLDYNPQFRSATEADRAWLRGLDMDAFAPMMDGPELCGLLAAGPRASGDAYRQGELNLLATLAEQTAVGLKNARLFTDLRRLNEEMQGLNDHLQATNEKLAAIDSAKTDFISIASHELRTPLTQLRGYSEVLGAMNQAGILKPDTVEQVTASLSKACERLEQVIGQMLDVSQIDVAAMAFRSDPTRLAEVIEEAVEPLRPAILDRRLELILQGIDEAPGLIGDGPRLTQAFSALIGNAVKYTPDGGRIEVTAFRLAGDALRPEAVEVVVADTGVGIDPKYHELIFEKFFRVGSVALHSTGSTKFMGAGPGLGLPLARGVVQGHGGRVWVESPGFNMQRMAGGRFHVWLPLRPPELLGTEPVRLEAETLRRELKEEELRALAPASALASPPR